MSETPAWLEPSSDPAPAAPMEQTPPTTLDTPSSAQAEPTSSPEDEKDLPTIILYMRLLNMAASVALVTISVSNS